MNRTFKFVDISKNVLEFFKSHNGLCVNVPGIPRPTIVSVNCERKAISMSTMPKCKKIKHKYIFLMYNKTMAVYSALYYTG